MNISFGLITSGKEQYKKQAEAVLSTWGNSISDYIYFFTDEEVENEKFIKATSDDTLFSNTEKILFGMNFLRKNGNTEWYFFGDDDCYINVPKLLSFLKNKKFDKAVCIARFINCAGWEMTHLNLKPWQLYYPSGGAGWIMNKKALEQVDDKLKEEFEQYYCKGYADVAVGEAIEQCGIEKVHNTFQKGQTPKFYEVSDKFIEEYTSFHHCDVNEMERIHSIINK